MGLWKAARGGNEELASSRRQRSIEFGSCNSTMCCDTPRKFYTWCGIIVAVLTFVATMLGVSIKKLGSTEFGLKYNVHSKELATTPLTGGIHIGPPGYVFITLPSTYISVDVQDTTCVSQDGLRVDISASYQYQMPSEWVYPAVLKYRNYDKWSTVVTAAGSSALQHACSKFNISSFENQRGTIQNTMEVFLRLKLEGVNGTGVDGVYARAIAFQLTNIGIPLEYQQAVQDKQSAQEDIALSQSQRTENTTVATTNLLAAMQQAETILNTAANDANVTLTQANFQAKQILFTLATEAQVVAQVKATLNLTTDGVISYMANRLYEVVSDLKVMAGEPANLSRKNDL